MGDESDLNREFEDDYYGFLNLPRDATNEQIKESYRKLSKIYHPDKHTDRERKQKADILFNRTKDAYEVLSDPHKRAIYDSVGIKGLKTDGWELVHRAKTPAEIREEYENLARAQEEKKLLQRTNPRGTIVVNVNATEIFAPYDEDEPPKVEVSSMVISQSIEAPITLKDTLILSGTLHSSNGTGSGNFLVSGRRLINKGWLELDIGAGNGPLVGVKGSRNLTKRIFCNGGSTFNFRDDSVISTIFGTLGVQLNKSTIGYLTYNFSPQSSMSTVVEGRNEKHVWSTSLTIGVPHCYLSASYTRKLVEYETKLKVAVRVGTFGFLTECGAEKKISKYSSVAAIVSIGKPTGVILKFKIIRSNQSYVFPIHLSEEIIPASVFYATVTPILVWAVAKRTIIDPMNKELKNIEINRAKKVNEERMTLKKEQAKSAIELMMHTYERIVSEENNKQGLIIRSALYGSLDFRDAAGQIGVCESVIDVTVPVQCLVVNSALQLYTPSKSELPGFYDPCIGENKSLRIDYTFDGREYSVTINDTDSLRLPIAN